jgi:hypothetical protein
MCIDTVQHYLPLWRSYREMKRPHRAQFPPSITTSPSRSVLSFWKVRSACWRDSTTNLTSSRRYMLAPCFLCRYASSCLSWPFSHVLCSIICDKLEVGIFLAACILSCVASIATVEPLCLAISKSTAVGVGGISLGVGRGGGLGRL